MINKEKIIARAMFKKIEIGIRNNHQWALLQKTDLSRIFKKEEILLLSKISKFSIDKIPKPFSKSQFVVLKNQPYKINGEIRFVKNQFLPKNVFQDFQKMNSVMEEDIGRSLNILSGYRSFVYQAIVFFYYFYLNKFNINKTLKRVAPPGKSEHSNIERQGVDFAPRKGIKLPKDFYKTKEYRWLLANASRFNFYLSYPKGNKEGIIFEPWHWHHKNYESRRKNKKFN